MAASPPKKVYTALPSGTCKAGQGFTTAQACYDAVAVLGLPATKVANVSKGDATLPAGCTFNRTVGSASMGTATFNTGKSSAACAASTTKFAKTSTPVGVTIQMQTTATDATFTLSGPSSAWFGVGWDASLMADQPYTFIVNDQGVTERKIGFPRCSEAEHCPGTLLNASIKLVSNKVAAGVRTAVVTRPLKGLTKNHKTFNPAVSTLKYINAVGSSQKFAYHKVGSLGHSAGMISLAAPTGATCVCNPSHTGALCNTMLNVTGVTGKPGSCATFVKHCVGHKDSLAGGSGSLLQQQNPTCNSGQYSGGLSCCSHKRVMLDADQTKDDAGPTLNYHMKIRYWFQEYEPKNAAKVAPLAPKGFTASHHDLPRIYQQTEANAGEYDIPPAFRESKAEQIVGYPDYPIGQMTPGTSCTGTKGTKDFACKHTISYNWTIPQMRLIYAGGACPACVQRCDLLLYACFCFSLPFALT